MKDYIVSISGLLASQFAINLREDIGIICGCLITLVSTVLMCVDKIKKWKRESFTKDFYESEDEEVVEEEKMEDK